MQEPPFNMDAEMSVLGAMLLNHDAALRAVELIGDDETAFFMREHQRIYSRMVSCINAGGVVDPVVLMAAGNDAISGGFIADLTKAVPTSANIEHYANIVLEDATRRKLHELARYLFTQTLRKDKSVDKLIEEFENGLLGSIDNRRRDTVEFASAAADAASDRLVKRLDNSGQQPGLSTGLSKLDALTSGLQQGDMIVLAARPSVGKTALALHIISAACKNGMRALLFSLEMNLASIMDRLICAYGGIDSERLRAGYMAKSQAWRIDSAAKKVGQWDLIIDDKSSITPLEMRSKALRLSAQKPIDLIVVDYLQLVTPPRKNENRQVEVSSISRKMKQLAKELNCPVIAISQLNRAIESRADNIPRLSDLRESGSLEQDADVVVLMSRVPKEENVLNVRVEKQRNGPTGGFFLHYNRSLQSFHQLAAPSGLPPEPMNGRNAPTTQEGWSSSEEMAEAEEGLPF